MGTSANIVQAKVKIENVQEVDILHEDWKKSGVSTKITEYKHKKALQVKMPSESYQYPKKEELSSRNFFVWLPLDFHNGTIDVDVAGVLATDAPVYARAFVGVAFRVESNQKFEAIYLRPVNSIVEDQVRRNHSVQYFSYPEYDFSRLRKETPEKYESYVDIAPDQWIHMKIEVDQDNARLYVNGAKQPTLMVNALKTGSDQRGGIGFWIESGTIGYFSDLKITHNN
jgi:hypothetical protein